MIFTASCPFTNLTVSRAKALVDTFEVDESKDGSQAAPTSTNKLEEVSYVKFLISNIERLLTLFSQFFPGQLE